MKGKYWKPLPAFLCAALLFSGCGGESSSTVLVENSELSGPEDEESGKDWKKEGEKVEPFVFGGEPTESDPGGKGGEESVQPTKAPESSSSGEEPWEWIESFAGGDPEGSSGADPEESSFAVESESPAGEDPENDSSSGVSDPEDSSSEDSDPEGEDSSEASDSGFMGTSFLAKLLHQEPTTLDDTQREIQLQSRLVWLIFEDSNRLSTEKSKYTKELLAEAGCEVIERFCGGNSQKLEAAFAEAVGNGAGTVICEMPETELPEDLVTLVENAGVRIITIGEAATRGLSTAAIVLCDETAGLRQLAGEALRLYPAGCYFTVTGNIQENDLAAQFDDYAAEGGGSLAGTAELPALDSESEESEEALRKAILDYPDVRMILCPNTSLSREAAVLLKRLGRRDIGILCLKGEKNILELIDRKAVSGAVVADAEALADTVLRTVDRIAEKGKAGEYALSYIPSLARMAE